MHKGGFTHACRGALRSQGKMAEKMDRAWDESSRAYGRGGEGGPEQKKKRAKRAKKKRQGQ